MQVSIEARATKQGTIEAIYAAVHAPAWAAANLDALADILRDLSWREPGPIALTWQISPKLPDDDLAAIEAVLTAAVGESVGSPHPLSLRVVTQPA